MDSGPICSIHCEVVKLDDERYQAQEKRNEKVDEMIKELWVKANQNAEKIGKINRDIGIIVGVGVAISGLLDVAVKLIMRK